MEIRLETGIRLGQHRLKRCHTDAHCLAVVLHPLVHQFADAILELFKLLRKPLVLSQKR